MPCQYLLLCDTHSNGEDERISGLGGIRRLPVNGGIAITMSRLTVARVISEYAAQDGMICQLNYSAVPDERK